MCCRHTRLGRVPARSRLPVRQWCGTTVQHSQQRRPDLPSTSARDGRLQVALQRDCSDCLVGPELLLSVCHDFLFTYVCCIQLTIGCWRFTQLAWQVSAAWMADAISPRRHQYVGYWRDCSSPLPPVGHIWDVMLVWRKGNINTNCLCVTVLCTIIMVHNNTSSSYRSVDCIGLWSCLV